MCLQRLLPPQGPLVTYGVKSSPVTWGFPPKRYPTLLLRTSFFGLGSCPELPFSQKEQDRSVTVTDWLGRGSGFGHWHLLVSLPLLGVGCGVSWSLEVFRRHRLPLTRWHYGTTGPRCHRPPPLPSTVTLSCLKSGVASRKSWFTSSEVGSPS